MRWFYYHPKLQKIQGYHFGVLCCAVVSAAVLIINLILTIWGYKHYGVHDGLRTIYEGSCSQSKRLAIWLHLAINILSTLLLGASNYTMQCLSSPTRQDIDKAHRQRIWLDIGTPSMKNLFRISRLRMVQCCLIAISSLPLHLMYNSAVFTTLFDREYNAFLVSPDFLTGASFNVSTVLSGSDFDWVDSEDSAALNIRAQGLQRQQSSLQRLENSDCISTYSTGIITHADVLAVTSYSKSTNPVLGVWPTNSTDSLGVLSSNSTNSVLDAWPSVSLGYASDDQITNHWYCPLDSDNYTVSSCNVQHLVRESRGWQLEGWDIEYCLAQPVVERCKLQFCTPIMAVVIICNVGKMIVMGYIAWKRAQEPLVTIGNAVASCLENPDLTTKGNCLAELRRFNKVGATISLSPSEKVLS